jgi:enoyl-[acyl-carrier protein] reductase III
MNQRESQNLVALITGGSRGIGRAIALRLATAGAQTIIVNYLQNDAEAEKTCHLIEAQNTRCILAKANLLYPDEIDKLFETVKASVDHLDCLVHCAALGAFKPLHEIKPNQWDLTMNINARGFLLCAQRAAALMKEGNILAISSLGSSRAVPNYGAMGPTKAALESIMRYLAVELAPAGIRVNAVTGGFVETDSIQKFPEADRLIQEAISRTPAKRLGTPEDIAEVVMLLLSPSSRWIYGQTIVADGGLSLL